MTLLLVDDSGAVVLEHFVWLLADVLLISQLLCLGFRPYDGGNRAPPEAVMIRRVISLQMAQSAL